MGLELSPTQTPSAERTTTIIFTVDRNGRMLLNANGNLFPAEIIFGLEMLKSELLKKAQQGGVAAIMGLNPKRF